MIDTPRPDQLARLPKKIQAYVAWLRERCAALEATQKASGEREFLVSLAARRLMGACDKAPGLVSGLRLVADAEYKALRALFPPPPKEPPCPTPPSSKSSGTT